MPMRRLTVSVPLKKPSCSARFDGLRLAHGWAFSTSSSSSMSRIVRAPSRRMRETTLRRSAGFTAVNHARRRCQLRRMARTKKRMSLVGT